MCVDVRTSGLAEPVWQGLLCCPSAVPPLTWWRRTSPVSWSPSTTAKTATTRRRSPKTIPATTATRSPINTTPCRTTRPAGTEAEAFSRRSARRGSGFQCCMMICRLHGALSPRYKPHLPFTSDRIVMNVVASRHHSYSWPQTPHSLWKSPVNVANRSIEQILNLNLRALAHIYSAHPESRLWSYSFARALLKPLDN